MTGRKNQMSPDVSGNFSSIELLEALEDLMGGPVKRLIAQQRLSRRHVYRVQVDVGSTSRPLVLKRFSSPHIAQRNQLVATRWLPAVGLQHAVPALLGIAAERDARHVWHIYEDLGECSLASNQPPAERQGVGHGRHGLRVFHAEPGRVEAAVRMIAEIHARFADHPLLGECRLYGDDFGDHFFSSAVRDAIRSLEGLLAPERELPSSRIKSLRHLLISMRRLFDEGPERARALAQCGGPETLLHGDLWPINVMVCPEGESLRARLIDWDHVGVGPVSYDLSNSLAHFPREDRRWILDLYLKCMEQIGWRFPTETDWNLLFDTAERSRVATTAFWRAMTALESRSDWAVDDVVAMNEWFAMLEPTFPPRRAEREVLP